ncbi:hypothetical protein R0137_01870 [Congregibacter brevis]|uniref:FHA domain-containing protein n=1 Tax=Congregibacter brevis TaxID=3081201 RepID=A0ABZ0ICQ6_9GAMM|nr:hypothetical protein R0137_01870 [Congregibacter sp. IMCC45268]
MSGVTSLRSAFDRLVGLSTRVFHSVMSKLSNTQALSAFWFFALLGTVPALRANVLLPHDWYELWHHGFVLPELVNPAGLLFIVPAAITGVLARRLGEDRYLLGIFPYLLVLLATLWADSATALFGLLYAVSALVMVLVFALYSQALSKHFGAFFVALLAWQYLDPGLSVWSVILLVLSVLVSRLGVEAYLENKPLLKALGRNNAKSLAKRTVALWWPMIFLLGLGIWFSAELERRSENFIYDAGLVTPFCHLPATDSSPEGPLLRCPPEHEELLNTQFAVLAGSEEGLAPRCEFTDPEFLTALAPTVPEPFFCPRSESRYAWPLRRKDLFDNIDLQVARTFDQQRKEMHASLTTVDTGLENSEELGKQEARRLFKAVPSSTGMSRRRCSFPSLACPAGNLVIGELNRAYRDARREAEKDFVAYMGGKAGQGAGTAQVYVKDARERLDETMDNYETRTRSNLSKVHTASTVVQQLLWLLLVVAFIKSVLYVASRVIFDQSTDIDIDLLERGGTPVQGTVTFLDEINVPADYPHNMYYKANYQPLGPAPRFSIPQWSASLLARLRHGAWNMSFVEMPMRDSNRLSFNAIQAEHLVDWEMKEGEEIVFNYGNFVAMNEHVELRTVVSLRIATLLLGRMVFHTARCSGGPGRLILRTRGTPARASQVEQSIPVARLVAFNRYARFAVDSHLTKADVFLNGFNLRRKNSGDEAHPQGYLIVEADARDGGILVGTLRFAKNFLLPL